MRKYNENIIYTISVGIFCVLSLVFLWLFNDYFYLVLGFNTILAYVGYQIAQLLKLNENKHIGWLIVIWMVWILFLPNAFYLVTDLIHLQEYTFHLGSYWGSDPYQPNDVEYVLTIKEWLPLGWSLLAILVSGKLGIAGIDLTKDFIERWNPKWYILILEVIFLASSFGIYLGRFIRLNSWNFYEIFNNLHVLGEWFTYEFVFMFNVIHWVFYMLMSKNVRRVGEADVRS